MQRLLRPYAFLMLTLSVGASLAWTIISGQDLNFDLVTYHYYLGYSAFENRLSSDFLPASYQGYQSPFPYALLYLLDSVGIPPLVNALIHAAFHSVNLIFLFLITQSLVGSRTGGHRGVIAFWAAGAIAPVYWSLVGTSFPDLFASVPVFAGLWLVSCASTGQRLLWRIAAGAALLGAASGIRLHNGIYVLALLIAIAHDARFFYPLSRVRVLAACSIAALGGWLLFFAPWAYRLYREFGNPIFPLYNALFRSPDFPASNLPISSFTPDNIPDLLTLPFRIATYAHGVYGETPLPDARPAVLAIAALALAARWAFRFRTPEAVAGNLDSRSEEAVTGRSQRLILVFFAVSAVLWIATSTNARYGILLLMLAGPVCGIVLSRLMPLRYALLVIGVLVLWQGLLQQLFFRQYRPPYTAWTSHYFDWEMPDQIKRTPATLLSFSYRTASVLAPYVHADSSHVNLLGQYTPNFDVPGSQRIRRLVDRHELVYAIFDSNLVLQPSGDWDIYKSYFRTQARFWGLDFTDRGCDLIVRRLPTGAWVRFNDLIGLKPSQPLAFVSCELRRSSPVERDTAREQLSSFAKKVARLGKTCPNYFGRPLSYIRVANTWTVTSFATFEARLDFEDEGPFYLQLGRAPYVRLELGRIKDDQLLPYEPDCGKWFSRLSELAEEAAHPKGAAQ